MLFDRVIYEITDELKCETYNAERIAGLIRV